MHEVQGSAPGPPKPPVLLHWNAWFRLMVGQTCWP